MRHTLLSFFFLWSYDTFSQSVESLLKRTNSIEEAEHIINILPKANLLTIYSDKDTLGELKNWFKKRQGDIFQDELFKCKIIESIEEPEWRVSYIFLNGALYSKTKVDSLRSLILKRYNLGTPFTTLVKEYTMDANPNGDLGWFGPSEMVIEFENAMHGKDSGAVFTVDVDEKQWYYVVLKTYHDRKRIKLSILTLEDGYPITGKWKLTDMDFRDPYHLLPQFPPDYKQKIKAEKAKTKIFTEYGIVIDFKTGAPLSEYTFLDNQTRFQMGNVTYEFKSKGKNKFQITEIREEGKIKAICTFKRVK